MNIDFITEMYIPQVLVVCLCVGFVIKLWLPLDNRIIPTVMLVLGAVLGCIFNGAVSIENVAVGMVSGLASTGLHQVFKQLLKLPMGEDEVYAMGDGRDVESEVGDEDEQ